MSYLNRSHSLIVPGAHCRVGPRMSCVKTKIALLFVRPPMLHGDFLDDECGASQDCGTTDGGQGYCVIDPGPKLRVSSAHGVWLFFG